MAEYLSQKVVEIALAEVGYLEKASNKSLDSKTENAGSKNYTKYARDLDGIKGFYNGRKQGAAWCDVFVDWCFVQAFGSETAKELLCQPNKSLGAGCKYSMNYYKGEGQFHTKPAVGDQIFFKSGSSITHTGLVYDIDKTYVYTVEGNTSSASGVVANGGAVAKKKYKLTNSAIAGYGRPAYTEGTKPAISKFLATPAELTTKEKVKAFQTAAKSDGVHKKCGYTDKNFDVDGIWGKMTEAVAAKAEVELGGSFKNCNKFAQKYLDLCGFDMSSSKTASGAYDGIIGKGSRKAIIDYKTFCGFGKPLDIIGKLTWKKILGV